MTPVNRGLHRRPCRACLLSNQAHGRCAILQCVRRRTDSSLYEAQIYDSGTSPKHPGEDLAARQPAEKLPA